MDSQKEKKLLIEQMGSQDNAVALAAVDALRERGWLQDGSLHGADLRLADLSEADLRSTNLRSSNLRATNLHGAILIEANLSRADLSGADVRQADLWRANLSQANFEDADLRATKLRSTNLRGVVLVKANLHRADLNRASLRLADLSDADLSDADLSGANLSGANLSGANLSGVNLSGTTLSRAYLNDANMSQAHCHKTIFADVNLSTVNGLETSYHSGPSTVGIDTLFASANLPEVFLRGCGVSESLIRFLPSLRNSAIEFYSCFISYSHADKAFAKRVHDTLQGQGIRCWLDEHEILPGDKVGKEIDRGIRIWDKVLLCCSDEALSSWWVDKEITMTLGKEEELSKERGEDVLALIPLDLDGYLFEEYEGEYERIIKARNVAGFKGWEHDNALFEDQIERVIRALRSKDAKVPPPTSKL